MEPRREGPTVVAFFSAEYCDQVCSWSDMIAGSTYVRGNDHSVVICPVRMASTGWIAVLTSILWIRDARIPVQ